MLLEAQKMEMYLFEILLKLKSKKDGRLEDQMKKITVASSSN